MCSNLTPPPVHKLRPVYSRSLCSSTDEQVRRGRHRRPHLRHVRRQRRPRPANRPTVDARSRRVSAESSEHEHRLAAHQHLSARAAVLRIGERRRPPGGGRAALCF